VRHRHLTSNPDTPVTEFGAAALDDLLDRGDFTAWTPLAREIARDPRGRLADTVLRLCDAHPMYGTSALWRTWIALRRGAPRADADQDAPIVLAEVRKRAGLTQADVAARMGISQADVSKLERRGDMRVSTLRAYARAVGVKLTISLDVQPSAGAAE
jgi:DNA-binding XRE family transcriptional regulator